MSRIPRPDYSNRRTAMSVAMDVFAATCFILWEMGSPLVWLSLGMLLFNFMLFSFED